MAICFFLLFFLNIRNFLLILKEKITININQPALSLTGIQESRKSLTMSGLYTIVFITIHICRENSHFPILAFRFLTALHIKFFCTINNDKGPLWKPRKALASQPDETNLSYLNLQNLMYICILFLFHP